MPLQKRFALLRIAVRRQLSPGEDKQQALGLRLLTGGLQQIVEGGDIHTNLSRKWSAPGAVIHVRKTGPV